VVRTATPRRSRDPGENTEGWEAMERMVAHGRSGEVEDIPPVLREETEAEIKDWYSPDELWRWLGLGRTKIYELLRSGEIPSYKIGRVRRIRRGDIEAWLEKNKT
jgi:excisionase family DNA binding protein